MADTRQIRKINFRELFANPDCYAELKTIVRNSHEAHQFVQFIRSSAFIETMKQTSKTQKGRENLAKALKDDELRQFIFANYDSHTVRWAIGDLFNSPDGQKMIGPLLKSPTTVLEIVKTMVTAKLPESEMLKDFNHFKKQENETLRASPKDLEWLQKGLSSDMQSKILLKELGKAAVRKRLVALLRTQEVRPFLNSILSSNPNRRRLAELLMSDVGLKVLDEAMKTPEGVNAVGYLWNMPNGKKMMSENMLTLDGIQAAYKIFGYQQRYNEIEKNKTELLKTKPSKK